MYKIKEIGSITFEYGSYQEKADRIGIALSSLSRILKENKLPNMLLHTVL